MNYSHVSSLKELLPCDRPILETVYEYKYTALSRTIDVIKLKDSNIDPQICNMTNFCARSLRLIRQGYTYRAYDIYRDEAI